MGFGPATGPTLKTALCHIRALVGRIDKYQRSTRTLSGTTRLHEVGSYVIVVAFPSPPLLVVDSTPFFLQIALLQGWIPLLVVDSLSFFIALVCTKGSAHPLCRAALKAWVSLFLPLRYLRSAKITPILAAASWPARSIVQSFGAQSLSYRPIRPHNFGAKSLSFRTALARKALAIVSILLHSFGAQALATIRYTRTALACKALATVRLVRTALARQSHSYRQ